MDSTDIQNDDAASLTRPELITLLSSGDVVLTATVWNTNDKKSFLVSSEILSMASLVFKSLFRGNMAESEELSKRKKLDMDLAEDDGDAMEIIFRILHHDPSAGADIMEMDLLARVAIHCDKYDCSDILRLWIASWLVALQHITEAPVDIGLHLLAQFRLQSAEGFPNAFVHAVKNLPPDCPSEWCRHDLLSLLPDSLTSELCSRIRKCQEKVWDLVQDVDLKLKAQAELYEMSYRECLSCGRNHPHIAMQCHPCNTKDLRQRYCNSETRTAGYIAFLRQAELWGAFGQ